jgi:hypothetical protein
MAQTPAVSARALDEKGVGRIGIGAGLGFAGAVCAIVVPLAFLFLVTEVDSGFFTFSSTLVEYTSILVLVGAILLLLSLFFYRRSFAALRKVDRRFVAASVLCILGALGFLLLLIAAGIVVGNSSSLIACAHGQPSHALSCLKSGQPLGAITGTVGFFLGWLGGVGVVVGLFVAGNRFRAGSLTGAAVVYALLLFLLLIPFLGLLVSIPDLGALVIVAPILAIIAPALALSGANRTRQAMGAS